VTDDDSSLKVPVFVVDDPELPAGECRVEGTLDQARDAAARTDKRKADEERRLAEPIAVVGDDDGDDGEAGERAEEEGPSAKRARVDDDEIVLLD
jgi:hypothetical protein